jgi:protein TonB
MQQAPLKPTTAADTKTASIPATPAQTPAQTPAAQTPAATSSTEAAAPVAEPPKASSPVTVATPKPDSLAARLRPAAPKELAEPPSLEGSGTAITARALPNQGPSIPPPAPVTPAPKPAAQAQQPAAQQAQPVKIGGNVEEAIVTRKVSPIYPPLARQARVSGIVRGEPVIGADGRVKKATALTGPPLLRQSAQEAVQRWIYQPGKLNGQPVEVTTQVDVSFTLNR